MGKDWLAAGGLLSALGASTCCVLPLSLGTLGLGGTWLSTIMALATYEMAFRVVGILLLAAYLLVRRRRSTTMPRRASDSAR